MTPFFSHNSAQFRHRFPAAPQSPLSCSTCVHSARPASLQTPAGRLRASQHRAFPAHPNGPPTMGFGSHAGLAIRMGRIPHPGVAKVMTMAARSGDLPAAWVACGRPTSWANVMRKWKAAAAEQRPATAERARPPARAARSRSRGSHSVQREQPTLRTGAKKTRRTSHQVHAHDMSMPIRTVT